MHHPESLNMVTWLKSPWGIPANYREMEGSSVNTYKLVNDQGEAVLVKFSFEPKGGVRNLTSKQAAEIQAQDVGHATRDLYDAIERGDYPEWEFCVQIMADGEHPELDFDPLDDTKRWPVELFPLLPVGRMVLNKNPSNFFAEVEQSAFGTGVLVDGIDFSDDKMLQGRTLSYSDTQRYRVGPELPAAAGQRAAGEGLCANQPARRADGLLRRPRGREPARQLRAELHGRPQGGAEACQGLPSVGGGAPRPLPDHEDVRRLQAGGRPLPHVPTVGARRSHRQPR
jgi:catalase